MITVIFKNDGLGLASLRLLLQPDKAMDSLGQGAWSIACVRVALPPCVWIRFDGRPQQLESTRRRLAVVRPFVFERWFLLCGRCAVVCVVCACGCRVAWFTKLSTTSEPD